MISVAQYFGHKMHTPEQTRCARDLLMRANALCVEYAEETGGELYADPDTGTQISGAQNGTGDGGFRLPTATTGKDNSSHKILPPDNPAGAGVDVYDQGNKLDKWLDQFETPGGGNTKLEEYGLYREHPDFTDSWLHLTNRAPGSKRRTFKP